MQKTEHGRLSHTSYCYHDSWNNIIFYFRQARVGELAEKSVGIIKNLMTCNYTNMDEYMQVHKLKNLKYAC